MEKRKWLRITLPAMLTVLLMATAVSGFAWLATHKSTEVSMSADHTPDISIAMGTHVPQTVKEYQWSAFVPVQKNHDVPGAYGAEFSITNKNSHFGEINNLTKVDNSNRAWFCLRIHQEEGKKFQNLRLNYNNPPYAFYGSIWEKGKPAGLKDVEQLAQWELNKNPGGKTVKDYLALITDATKNTLMKINRPTADADFITDQKPGAGWQAPAVNKADNAEPDAYVQLAGNVTGNSLNGLAQKTDADGYYYVYFRVEPNLLSYYEFVKNLYPYMPCYLSFRDLTVSVDVTTDTQ